MVFFLISFLALSMSKHITDLDLETSVFLSPFGSAAMQITSNPSTGYSWNLIPPSSFLIKVLDPKGEYTPANTKSLGAPGIQTFEILCTELCHEGDEQEITLVYSRPWENDPARIKTVTVHITTDPNLL